MVAHTQLIADICDALVHAAQQAGDLRWASVPLCAALDRACVLALSSYETAQAADILDPASARQIAVWEASDEAPIVKGPRPPAKIAPPLLLLRRVRSADYLADPERLHLPMKTSKAIKHLLSWRNRMLHVITDFDAPAPEHLPRAARAACDVLTHLLVTHPAFDAGRFVPEIAMITRQIEAIRQGLQAGTMD